MYEKLTKAYWFGVSVGVVIGIVIGALLTLTIISNYLESLASICK